ncbi:MAG: CHRD domain-containing protein [Caulobacteraceae bacterium]|nr:CHRD domain-containing protein [Caulobacteraceae bacterium]
MPRAALIAAAGLMILAAAPFAAAETVHFTAHLDGAQETPPNDSKATGDAKVAYDTDNKTLIWSVTYSGLSGPATMAHFHGPATAGKAAPVVINFGSAVESPIHGSAVLTQGQVDQLMNGLWYVNVHTAAHPAGEIRGQVEKAK